MKRGPMDPDGSYKVDRNYDKFKTDFEPTDVIGLLISSDVIDLEDQDQIINTQPTIKKTRVREFIKIIKFRGSEAYPKLIEALKLRDYCSLVEDLEATPLNNSEETKQSIAYTVEVVEAQSTNDLGLRGQCELMVGLTDLSLYDVNNRQEICRLPFKYIRKYGANKKKGIFRLETGRRCATGEGSFAFFSTCPSAIQEMVDDRIAQLHQNSSSRQVDCSDNPNMTPDSSVRATDSQTYTKLDFTNCPPPTLGEYSQLGSSPAERVYSSIEDVVKPVRRQKQVNEMPGECLTSEKRELHVPVRLRKPHPLPHHLPEQGTRNESVCANVDGYEDIDEQLQKVPADIYDAAHTDLNSNNLSVKTPAAATGGVYSEPYELKNPFQEKGRSLHVNEHSFEEIDTVGEYLHPVSITKNDDEKDQVLKTKDSEHLTKYTVSQENNPQANVSPLVGDGQKNESPYENYDYLAIQDDRHSH